MTNQNNLKKRDKYEAELKGIQYKINNAKNIRTNMQSWYNKRELEYIEFLKSNDLEPNDIQLSQPLE